MEPALGCAGKMLVLGGPGLSPGRLALPAAGPSPPLAIAAAPLLPDVWRGAEPGGLPPQPRQHGPPLALQADQLRVAQHPAHQLLVPPDARGRVLPRDGHGPQLGARDEQIRAVS